MDVADQSAFVRAWGVQTRRIGWLLGAGASASAGLPTASQVRDDLLLRVFAERHGLVRQSLRASDPKVQADLANYFDGRNGMPKFGSPDDYSSAFELALPDEGTRRQYLHDRLKDKQPSYGQRVLGALLCAGQVDVVATTNFDDLIEKSAAGAYAAVRGPSEQRLLNVAALGSRDRARRVLDAASLPMLIKLHGDFQESSLKNLDSELANQDGVLRQSVIDLSRNYGLAAVGYSGRDDSVMKMLEDASNIGGAWPGGLWWFTREIERTDQRVFDLLDRARAAGTIAHLVILGSFDELMGRLALQVELPDQARSFVDQLQPKQRVTAAAPPSGRERFPVIRYNALPLLEAPTSAMTAAFSGMDRTAFRARVKEVGFRGVVAMGSGTVWGWSEPEPFEQLAGATVETHQIDVTSTAPDGVLLALTLEGLTRSICARLPARPKITRRAYSAVLTRFDVPRDEHLEILKTFENAYGERLFGKVPGGIKFGANRAGEARSFAEALRLNLEHRWGVTWLIFTPYTWVEPWCRPDDVPRAPDPVNDWIRERWVARKRNEDWANLIATWTNALAPQRQKDALRLTRSMGGTAFGQFRLGPVSAYSRRASS